MPTIKDDWILQRQGFINTQYHLGVMLVNTNVVSGKLCIQWQAQVLIFEIQLTVGRRVGNGVDIVCDGKTVSRKHCELRAVDNQLEIRDLGVCFHQTNLSLQQFK